MGHKKPVWIDGEDGKPGVSRYDAEPEMTKPTTPKGGNAASSALSDLLAYSERLDALAAAKKAAHKASAGGDQIAGELYKTERVKEEPGGKWGPWRKGFLCRPCDRIYSKYESVCSSCGGRISALHDEIAWRRYYIDRGKKHRPEYIKYEHKPLK